MKNVFLVLACSFFSSFVSADFIEDDAKDFKIHNNGKSFFFSTPETMNSLCSNLGQPVPLLVNVNRQPFLVKTECVAGNLRIYPFDTKESDFFRQEQKKGNVLVNLTPTGWVKKSDDLNLKKVDIFMEQAYSVIKMDEKSF